MNKDFEDEIEVFGQMPIFNNVAIFERSRKHCYVVLSTDDLEHSSLH